MSKELRFSAFRTVSASIFVAAQIGAVAQAQELAYGLVSGWGYWQFDPTNLNTGSFVYYEGGSPLLLPFGTACAAGRLLTLDTLTNNLCSIHPADGRTVIAGPTGVGLSGNQNYGLEWVPSLGALVAVNGDTAFLVDPANGTTTYLGVLTGIDPYDGIRSMALSTSGTLVGFGVWKSSHSGVAVYVIDLNSLTATWQAYFPTPAGASFHDVAYRSNGELWASVDTFSSATTGLYTIDLNAYSMTRVLAMPSPPFGLAFGPGTVTSSFCTAKATSNGCVPLISGAGNASATARHGYTISCSNVRNQAAGLLTFGLSGQAALPFGGGTLCVAAPRLRAGVHDSRGTAAPAVDCSGAWSLDFNKWHAIQPWIPAGATICAQWIGRDPGFAPPANYILSDALEFSVIP